jgi:hypothetical protein
MRLIAAPPKNGKGKSLLGDGLAAFVTEAIMRGPSGAYLMGIFKDFDKFTLMSHGFLDKNTKMVLAKYPKSTEDELAARVARDGGEWRRTLAELTSSDQFDYVKLFLAMFQSTPIKATGAPCAAPTN